MSNLIALSRRPGVLALSFGVTYWDQLGWKDVFARPDFTARQATYKPRLGHPGLLTLQTVVNGRIDAVGNRLSEVEALIAQARSDGGPDVTLAPDAVRIAAGAISPVPADVWLVRYEPNIIEVPVGRGENTRRTLPHARVVRDLVRIGTWSARVTVVPVPPAPSGLRSASSPRAPAAGRSWEPPPTSDGDGQMLLRFPKTSQAREEEVTPRARVLSRRAALAGGASTLAMPLLPAQAATFQAPTTVRPQDAKLDELTPLKSATTYNNFYEFGTGKSDPADAAGPLRTRPWEVVVDGEVATPTTFGIEELLRFSLEERIYRLRCVEAWSMVIPWIGLPLAELLKRVEPTGVARYVAFQTLRDPAQMPGQRSGVLEWPYVEGLRLDEAMHPLTILAVGMYGEALPNQNGAPVRLVVPWKYGFKSIKSVVRIRLTRDQPPTTWNRMQAREYGFYANVNPDVDHPRWSQASERRVGAFFRRKTLPFNGYAEEVASLYTGMDLRVNY